MKEQQKHAVFGCTSPLASGQCLVGPLPPQAQSQLRQWFDPLDAHHSTAATLVNESGSRREMHTATVSIHEARHREKLTVGLKWDKDDRTDRAAADVCAHFNVKQGEPIVLDYLRKKCNAKR